MDENLFIQKAKQAGHSDQEIQAFIAQKKGSITGGQSLDMGDGLPQPMENKARDAIINSLPIVGGVAGSFLPGVGTIVGGALGAGVGAALKEGTDENEGFSVGNVAKETALAGAGGLVAKGAGTVISKAIPSVGKTASKLGGRMEDNVLNPLVDADPFYSENVARLTKTAKDYGLTKKASIDSLEDLPGVFRGVEKRIGQELDSIPTPVDTTKTVTTFDDIFSKNSSVTAADPAFISAREETLNRLTKLNGGGKILDATGNPIITPTSARDIYKLKSELRGELYSAFKKMDMGNGNLTPVEEAKMAMYNALKVSLDGVSPTIRELNRIEHDFFELSKGLVKSSKKKGGIGFGAIKIPLPNQTQQGITSRAGNAVRKGGELLESMPNIPGGPLTRAGVATGAGFGSVLPVSEGGDYTQDQNNTQNSPDHMMPNIPQESTRVNNDQVTYVTGYSPEKLGQAYMAAYQAGDTASAKQLKAMYEFEKAHQKEFGGGSKTKPLSAVAQTAVTKATSALSSVDRIEKQMTADPAIFWKKINPLDQSGRQIGADIASAIDVLGFFRTGAAITPEQRKDYIYMFPSKLDSPATAQEKLRRLREEFAGYAGIGTDTPELAPTTNEEYMPEIPQAY